MTGGSDGTSSIKGKGLSRIFKNMASVNNKDTKVTEIIDALIGHLFFASHNLLLVVSAVEVAPNAPRSWEEVELELAVQEKSNQKSRQGCVRASGGLSVCPFGRV